MTHLSFLDATEDVLRRRSQGAPVHRTQIWEWIAEEELVDTQGKTPVETLSASLNTEIKRRDKAGLPQRFTAMGNLSGLYGLVEYNPAAKQEADAQQMFLDAAQESLKQRLTAMSWDDFERVCVELFIALGVADAALVTPGTPVYDFQGTFSEPPFTGMGMLGQVKHTSKKSGAVDLKAVQALQATGDDHTLRFMVTNGTATSKARVAAADSYQRRVNIIDGDQLIALLLQNEVGVRKEQVEVFVDEPFGYEGSAEVAGAS